jgi:hypothetical protein
VPVNDDKQLNQACHGEIRMLGELAGLLVVGHQDRDGPGGAGAEQIKQIVSNEERLGRLDGEPPA